MPVTIYPGHRLNTLQPQLRYYLDTRGPGKTRLRSATRPGFLDFSPEIRNLIYDYAVVLKHPIERRSKQRKRPWLSNPNNADRQARAEISTCFNFMLSCRTIYYEARSMFWGCNVFSLEAVPTECTNSMDEDTDGVVTDWRFNIPVKAPGSRLLIRRVVLRPSYAWSGFLVMDTAGAGAQSNVPLPSIVDLLIQFDRTTSEIAECPLPHAIDGMFPNGSPALQRLKDTEEVQEAHLLYRHIESALQALADKCPDLRTIHVNGFTALLDSQEYRDGLKSEGLVFEPFGIDTSLIRSLSAKVRNMGKDFVFEGAQDIIPCQYCGDEWSREEWEDYKQQMDCPECPEDLDWCECDLDWYEEACAKFEEDGYCPACAG
ncbi:hypothetical protein LTS10_010281 [Elasticomyces elasticus]|nr:hypothetical protein LTS10_010281 [Elasticomyces elasticus]